MKEEELEEQSKAFLNQANETSTGVPAPSSKNDMFGVPKIQKTGAASPPGLAAPFLGGSVVENKTNLLSQVLQTMLKTEIALSPESQRGWYYYDANGTLQGPFDGTSMAEWYDAGYLPGDLKLCSSGTGERYPIAAFIGQQSNATGQELFSTDIDHASVLALKTGLSSLMESL